MKQRKYNSQHPQKPIKKLDRDCMQQLQRWHRIKTMRQRRKQHWTCNSTHHQPHWRGTTKLDTDHTHKLTVCLVQENGGRGIERTTAHNNQHRGSPQQNLAYIAHVSFWDGFYVTMKGVSLEIWYITTINLGGGHNKDWRRLYASFFSRWIVRNNSERDIERIIAHSNQPRQRPQQSPT